MEDHSASRSQPVSALLGADCEAERRHADLGRAAERNGLAWYAESGEMLFQPPADMIAEQAEARGYAKAVAELSADANALSLIRQMTEEKVRFDQENYDAIPRDYVGLGFTVEQYWRDRVTVSMSWRAFCADPINHPCRKNLPADGALGRQDGTVQPSRDEPPSISTGSGEESGT